MKSKDLAILHAIHRRGEASTVEIADDAQLLLGTVWAGVDRLEEDGYIQTWLVKGGPERGYRDKRMCRLTGHGLAEVGEMAKW